MAAACAPSQRSKAPRHRVARVHSFTEATPVYRVVSAPPYAFAATATGLDQWDLRSGRRIDRGSKSDLFTTRIADVAYDSAHKTLWFVGSDGIARYDLASGSVEILEPPVSGGIRHGLANSVLMPGPSGGVYLGVASSLFYADPDGNWTEAALDAPVSSLHVGEETVYVGTAIGMFALSGSDALPIECDLAAVDLVLEAPGGGVLAVGVADAGAQRVAFYDGSECTTFRPSPEVRWLDVAFDGDRAIVLTPTRVYELAAKSPKTRMRRLTRRGMTLIPTDAKSRKASQDVRLRELEARIPPGAQTVAVSGGELLVGTRSLGTARLALDGSSDRDDSRWLRRSELADRAAHLSVHCDEREDCRLANGSGELWRFDGERFVRQDRGGEVLAVLDVDDRVLVASRQAGSSIVELRNAPTTGELADPLGEHATLASVRVPLGFSLHRLRSGPGQSVVIGWTAPGADLAAPLVLVQWVPLSSASGRTLGVGGGALVDVVACGARLFVAGPAGVFDVTANVPVEISNQRVSRLGCDRDQLIAATPTALLRRRESGWTEALPLTAPIRDFAIARDGRIFLADESGLGIWDGDRVRRYDVRRGLLENDLREIRLDRFGRIWIRGANGVGLFRL